MPRKVITATERAIKGVSFSLDVAVKRTLINDYSDKEIEATWFDQADFDRIHKEVHFIVELMEKIEHIDEDKYCTRGLEFRTKLGMEMRLHNRVCARDAVFDEQEFQWKESLDEPDAIRVEYQMYASPCLKTAHFAGLLDEKMAKGLHGAKMRRLYKRWRDLVLYQSGFTSPREES